MNLDHLGQWLIVGGVVSVSALYMIGRVVPRWRASLAQHLLQSNYPSWINAMGERLNGNSGCGSCDTCGGCAPKKESSANAASEHAH